MLAYITALAAIVAVVAFDEGIVNVEPVHELYETFT
jgi:hypothetical protein